MVVAGVPAAGLVQRAPSEAPGMNSLLRLDSWRLPAGNAGPGRAGSEVFIDTDKGGSLASNAEAQLVASLPYAPSEGGEASLAHAFSLPFLGSNGEASMDEKMFQEYRGDAAAAAPSTSAPSRQADASARFSFNQLLPSVSQDDKEWRQTLGESFGPQRDVFVGRPSTFDIHSARTNALALKQAADNAAEEANEKEEAAEAARKAQDQVNKALTSVSVSKAGEQRAPAYAPILSQAPASLVGAQQARRKRGEDAAFRAPPQLRTGTLQPPAVRRTPAAAPATNAIKRMAGAASADEFAEPHAKKHRADVSLAQQETPIADHADEQLAAGQVTVNSVKATDHWVDNTGRKCRRGCLHCGMQKTPQWRMGPLGPKTLCNACGVRYRKEIEIREARSATKGAGASSLGAAAASGPAGAQ